MIARPGVFQGHGRMLVTEIVGYVPAHVSLGRVFFWNDPVWHETGVIYEVKNCMPHHTVLEKFAYRAVPTQGDTHWGRFVRRDSMTCWVNMHKELIPLQFRGQVLLWL